MSGFWEKQFVAPAPAAAPPQQPQAAPQAASEPWWRTTPAQPVQQPQQEPGTSPEDLGSATLNPRQAQSLRADAGSCPDCGSSNYFEFKAHGSSSTRCYECGYNPKFTQMGAGGGLPSDNGAPATPTRQVSTANNFNPQQIVGSVPGQR